MLKVKLIKPELRKGEVTMIVTRFKQLKDLSKKAGHSKSPAFYLPKPLAKP